MGWRKTPQPDFISKEEVMKMVEYKLGEQQRAIDFGKRVAASGFQTSIVKKIKQSIENKQNDVFLPPLRDEALESVNCGNVEVDTSGYGTFTSKKNTSERCNAIVAAFNEQIVPKVLDYYRNEGFQVSDKYIRW
jgi:hypothetical protein